MIIQIDHVSISSMDFAKHIRIMKSLGYEPVFIEKNIKNPQIKHEFMTGCSKMHDLALLTSKGKISVELINHGNINQENGYIYPVFENISDNFIEKTNEKSKDDIFVKGKLKCLDAAIYTYNNMNTGFRFNKMIIETRDINNSTTFFECLGFRFFQKENDYVVLDYTSIFKDDCQLYLKKNDSINNKHYLDDRGFNCIALISTSAINEKEYLDKKGIRTTEIENFTVNRKNLDIFFAVGDSGELAEIIGIGNR